MNITVRKATIQDINAVEYLYNHLNDYLATHVNYPRWKKGVYPIREDAETALREANLYVAVAHGEVIGKQQGARAIRLDTYEDNLPAARLYEKCGFRYMGLVDLGLEELYGLKWYRVFEKVL